MIKVFDGKFSLNFLKICVLAYEIAKDEYLQNNNLLIENADKNLLASVLVAPKHLFLALSIYPDSLAFSILSKFKKINKIFDANLDARINDSLKFFNNDFSLISVKFDAHSRKIVDNALMVAASYDHFYIGTEHLLYSLLKNDDDGLKLILITSGLNVSEVLSSVLGILKSISNFSDITDYMGFNVGGYNKRTPALDFFSTELTDVENQKNIDPVILREKEIDRLIYILSRRYKNNPILLGNAGVGKTAIVEGLAKRILNNEVPDVLIGKRIFNLDLNSVVAGASYRGEFEVRLKDIIEEVNTDPNIILFIDEIHSIVGAGSNTGNGDAANILKPALAKSKVKVIGATTFEEYKQYIEKDSALERRFQPVYVNEPSVDETIELLKGIKGNYEKFHNVKIEEEALVGAAKFSKRYITDKFLPDKAIDLIDEACARIKVKNTNNILLKDLIKLERSIEKLEIEKDSLIESENFEAVIEIKNKQSVLVEKLEGLKILSDARSKKKLGVVTLSDVANIVSDISSVPVDNILHNNISLKLKNLDNGLRKDIIGQNDIISSIISYIKRGIFESNFKDKPLASFLFVGKSGTGKTEIAKNIAKNFFDNEENFIRFDMSEYSENIGITSLIGAPAGYVGYREGGVLTDAVRRKPYSVVLFDDADKAHPKVLSLIQEILDSGFITDATGKKISFKNTVVVISTNLGNEELSEKDLGFNSTDEKNKEVVKSKNEKENLNDLAKEYFTSEFIAKIDKVLAFNDLTKDNLKDIAKIKINALSKYLPKDCKIEVSNKVLDHVAELAVKNGNGARGVDSAIFDEIENQLIDSFIDNENFDKIKEINIDYNKKISLKIK